MKNGKRRGQKKQKRKGAYDKSGGITHDTAAFAFRTKDILKIRSRPRLEPGSDYHYLVPEMGLEPIWISPFDFKSNAYTNSAIRAYLKHSYMTLCNHLQSQPTCCKDCCNFCCRLTITQMSMFCYYYTTKIERK